MPKEIPLELIHNLARSNADNAAEAITLEIRLLGERHGLSVAAQMEIGVLVITQRQMAVVAALECASNTIYMEVGVYLALEDYWNRKTAQAKAEREQQEAK